jgi:uncharacterized damage-inducible protein DinB
MRPKAEDHIPYFSNYIGLVPENSIMEALEKDQDAFLSFISTIPESKAGDSYAPGKWTIKQVISHVIDTERIFSYRALCFARGEKQTLPGFEENDYAANANLENTDLHLLAQEFDVVRRATILLFKQLGEKELLNKGMMASGQTNVLSLGYTICGHGKHHVNVMKERYL